MIRQAVLEGLSRAVDNGDEEVAYAALGQLDPLLRWVARRRVKRAVEDALVRCPADDGVESARHRMRVAFLSAAGEPPPADRVADGDDVRARFEAARPPPRRRGRLWWVSALVTLAALAAGTLAAVALVRALSLRPPYDATRRAARPPAGAFADGGRPATDAAVAAALGTGVPDYLIALDRWASARRKAAQGSGPPPDDGALAEARARALAPEAAAALGPAGARRLEQVLAQARAVAVAPAAEVDRAGVALLQAVGALDDDLAAAGLGYYLDGDVMSGDGGAPLVLLYTFQVDWVSRFAADGRPVRALHVRRLDHLNWSHTLVGFTRPHLRDAVVLLDQADELLVTYVVPALAPGERVSLVDHDSAAEPWVGEVEQAAAQAVRGEYAAGDASSRLGALLARRRARFESWQQTLDARGLTLETPGTLRLSASYQAELAGLVPAEELDELTTLDAALAEPALGDAFATARARLLASVERHEVQHRIDFARATPRPLPRALEDGLGPLHDERTGEERPAVVHARDELSAYLGELARDELTPRTNLTLLARFLFDRDSWGAPECYAALVVIEGLAEEMKAGDGKPLLVDHAIDRARVAGVYLALVAAPPAELRAAAGRLWERLFSAPLPLITHLAP